jgi:hypothetical protein
MLPLLYPPRYLKYKPHFMPLLPLQLWFSTRPPHIGHIGRLVKYFSLAILRCRLLSTFSSHLSRSNLVIFAFPFAGIGYRRIVNYWL